LEAPIDYTQSMSSKNVRLQLIDAFSLWLPLPPSALCIIKDVINYLHNSSLMIDDIQDGSLLRRGETATHVIFGQAQTINSATYMFVQATKIIHYLHKPALITVMIEELENLFIGQSWELRWRSTMYCPSENEYFAMVDHKTGSMFRMLLRLMLTMGESEVNNTVFDSLSRVMGRWYQVRDDYLNLVGTEYTKKKGFCEDLDEGKFSYPVIRCCANAATRDIVLGIIQRRNLPNLPVESKLQVLRLMEKTGVIRATWDLVMKLQNEIEGEIGRLEVVFGEKNPIFRLLIKVLADIPRPGSGSC
jgi:geranylgeranyl pyrophosphate synthase